MQSLELEESVTFHESDDGYLEIYPKDLLKIIKLVNNPTETAGYSKAIQLCEEYKAVGMTPHILWDENSYHLIVRCDELKGKFLN